MWKSSMIILGFMGKRTDNIQDQIQNKLMKKA